MCFPYVDDIFVSSASLEQHCRDLRFVFQCFRDNQLATNVKKCEFGKPEITFPGHPVTPNGIRHSPEKVAVLKGYPKPLNSQELKRFIGMMNFYRKFLPHTIAYQEVLQDMITGNKTKYKTPLVWSSNTESAFERCKTELCNVTLLAHSVPGAGNMSLLAFYSKKLTVEVFDVRQRVNRHLPSRLPFSLSN